MIKNIQKNVGNFLHGVDRNYACFNIIIIHI